MSIPFILAALLLLAALASLAVVGVARRRRVRALEWQRRRLEGRAAVERFKRLELRAEAAAARGEEPEGADSPQIAAAQKYLNGV